MSQSEDQKLTWFDAPDQPPGIEIERARQVSPRLLLVRFAFGAGTSAVAGTISIVWNSKTAGVMLAFPAILAASLTLIANEDSRRAAREDARGAFVGAIALAVFLVGSRGGTLEGSEVPERVILSAGGSRARPV